MCEIKDLISVIKNYDSDFSVELIWFVCEITDLIFVSDYEFGFSGKLTRFLCEITNLTSDANNMVRPS